VGLQPHEYPPAHFSKSKVCGGAARGPHPNIQLRRPMSFVSGRELTRAASTHPFSRSQVRGEAAPTLDWPHLSER
jgi:hypothetical protein